MALINSVNDTNSVSNQTDFFSDILTIPVNKLDADQYAAEDLDGVTESIFGSGNMNFLSLQAGQTNELISLNNSAENFETTDFTPSLSGIVATTDLVPASFFSSGNDDFFKNGTSYGTDTARPIDNTSGISGENNSGEGNFTNTTVGSLGASALSSDSGSFSSVNGLSLFNNSKSDSNVNTTTNINNAGDVITNTNFSIIEQTIQNITNFGDELITEIFEGDLIDILNSVTNEVTEITQDITNILNEFGITQITNTFISNVNNIINNILGDGQIALDLTADILDTVGVDLNAIINGTIHGALDTNATTDNIGEIVQQLTGIELPLLPDLGATLSFDLLNPNALINNEAGDFDIAISGLEVGILEGLQLPDIALDPVEAILGDIDLTLNIPGELLNPETLIAAVTDLGNALDDLNLGNLGNALEILGDEGLEGALEIELINTVIGDDFSVTINDIIDAILSDTLPGTPDLGNIVQDPIAAVQDLADNLIGGSDGGGNPLDLMNGILPEAPDLGDIAQDPVAVIEDLADNLLGGTDGGGTPLDLLDGILGNGNDNGDTDISIDLVDGIADIQPVTDVIDITLDPVESLVGDIDLPIDIGLLGSAETHNTAGDSDLTINNDINIAGIEVPDLNIDIPLDPIESLIGDIDLDIDVDLDLLNEWTENPIGDIGGLFDDIISNDLGNAALPEPLGGIAEGLGALDIPHHGGGHHGGGVLGGLGGLFG